MASHRCSCFLALALSGCLWWQKHSAFVQRCGDVGSRSSGTRTLRHACKDESVEKKLERKFRQSSSTPLFRDVSTYVQSLPIRQSGATGKNWPLYPLPHWAVEADVLGMSEQLAKSTSARCIAKYISGPPHSGKTSCVLPAFVASNYLTHYLYVAFANNNRRIFKLVPFEPASEHSVAEEQGAAFISSVMKILLDEPDRQGPYEISVASGPVEVESVKRDLTAYLESKLGKDFQCLVHLDEHPKMCDRSGKNGARFSYGAISTLARVPGVTVVATYTEPPYNLPAMDSSAVCRSAVAKPTFDIRKAVREVPDLQHLQYSDSFTPEQKRLWATLMARLHFKLQEFGLLNLHERKDVGLNSLLSSLEATSSIPSPSEMLRSCIQLCRVELPDLEMLGAKPERLLLGVKDEDLQDLPVKVRHPMVVQPQGSRLTLLTAPLEWFFTAGGGTVYEIGQERLRKTLEGTLESDWCSQTPLEVAYTWVLSTRAAELRKLRFHECVVAIRCVDVKPSRIFPDTDNTVFSSKPEHALQQGVLYYADEKRKGITTHPLADLFFLTDDGKTLVLVDITGGSAGLAEQKGRRLQKWIQTVGKNKLAAIQTNLQAPDVLELQGVVLAPLAVGLSESKKSVEVVQGMDARELLGGLDQIIRWFGED